MLPVARLLTTFLAVSNCAGASNLFTGRKTHTTTDTTLYQTQNDAIMNPQVWQLTSPDFELCGEALLPVFSDLEVEAL